MRIKKCEEIHDYFGRKFWRIWADDGRWIQFGEHAGWTEKDAREAFMKNFDYYWNHF